ncbi:MAG: hypothetical protein U9N84_09690 [Actinomycetota bacterium]|nr:hypothetical protein [Actinomycetota bacterium]
MRRITIAMLAMALMLVSAVQASASAEQVAALGDTVWDFDSVPVAGTNARLTLNDGGVAVQVHTRDLAPGHAYTMWFVVFNNPAECVGTFGGGIPDPSGVICSEDDLFNPDVDAVVLYGSGKVIGGSGEGNFAARLNVGDISGVEQFGLPGMGELTGLQDTDDFNLHAVLRDHGPMDPAYMPA